MTDSKEMELYRQERISKRLEDLEKENKELKEKVEHLQKYLDTQNSYRECAETWLKLTKAKEIISAFVEWANWQGGGCPSFKSIQDNAEQFLKEIEK